MAEGERRPMIVTFKRKEQRQRADRERDKLAVFTEVSGRSDVRFFDTDSLSRGVTVPSGLPMELMGYDMNRYDSPLVISMLSDQEIELLRANNSVEMVEEDGPVYAMPGGPESLVIEGQPSVLAETIPAGVAQIKAPTAWNSSRGQAIKVFVLDTGIDGAHPDLAANFKGGTSFVPTESSTMDYNSHGTHCAGTIAASFTGSGVVGVAPNAYLYAVKVLSASGSGSWSYLIAGIDWVMSKKGLRILSMSLGGSAAPSALEAACKAAYNDGCLLIAAAGNSGGAVGFPARYESVVAVSAIDSGNLIAGFSSRGQEVELSAPGVNVLSTIPGGGYGTKSGTSMACPHVAGAAALAWGSHRYSDNVIMRRLLAYTSDPLGIPGRDDLYGFGRVDAEQSAASTTSPPAVPGIPTVPMP